jgi:DNA-binding NarL/FixJ family response regulator
VPAYAAHDAGASPSPRHDRRVADEDEPPPARRSRRDWFVDSTLFAVAVALGAIALRALRAGAGGFLLKDTPPADIVRALRAVAAGEPMLSPAITRRLIGHVTDSERDDRRRHARERLDRLTEREVAVAVGLGKSNAEIGRELYMSVATVKAHVSRVLDKLEFNNRVQIALLAHDAGEA